jgi:hypothetical protein
MRTTKIKEEIYMNPYALLGRRIGSTEAEDLSTRLRVWHDEMVAHERRLRTGDACDEECPHVEARALWNAAVETFGDEADELIFLRTRASGQRPRPRVSA